MTVKRFNFSRFGELKQQVLGLAFLLGCLLMGSVESAAQSLSTSPYNSAVNVRAMYNTKTPIPVNVATTNLQNAIDSYRSQLSSAVGANEALFSLRLSYFTGIKNELDGGKPTLEALQAQTPFLLGEANVYSPSVVTNAALNAIVSEAISLIAQ